MEELEQIMRRIHLLFAKCEPYGEEKGGKIIVPKKEVFRLLEKLNYAVIHMMDEYEGTAESRERGMNAYHREGERVRAAAQAGADDVYAASLIYVDNMLEELHDVVADAKEELWEQYARMASRLDAHARSLSEDQEEIKQLLTAMAQGGKYLKIIEHENIRLKQEEEARARREAESYREDMDGNWEGYEDYEEDGEDGGDLEEEDEGQDTGDGLFDVTGEREDTEAKTAVSSGKIPAAGGDAAASGKANILPDGEIPAPDGNGILPDGETPAPGRNDTLPDGKVPAPDGEALIQDGTRALADAVASILDGSDAPVQENIRVSGTAATRASSQKQKGAAGKQKPKSYQKKRSPARHARMVPDLEEEWAKEEQRPVRKIGTAIYEDVGQPYDEPVKRVSYEIKVNQAYFDQLGEGNVDLDAEYYQWKEEQEQAAAASEEESDGGEMVGETDSGKKSNNKKEKKKRGLKFGKRN